MMKSDLVKTEKATVAATQASNMRPLAKTMGSKASEMIELQQAKAAVRKKIQDEMDQEASLEKLETHIATHEGQETWEVAQAGLVGQLAAGGQAVGAGAGAAGVGSGAAAAAASSGAYVGIAPTTGIFATPNTGSTGSATTASTSMASAAMNLGAALAVTGVAAAAGGSGASNDKVAPGTPVIARAIDDVNPVTTDVNNAGVTNDTRPQLFITAASGSTVKVYKMDGNNAVPVSGTVVEGPAGSYTFTPTDALANSQAHTFKASATDSAGNESALSTPFTLTMDTTAPAMPTLVVNNIAGNNDVSPAEAAGNVNVTGTTSAPNGSVVTISVNGKTFTGTVDGGTFTVRVPGADLVADPDTQLSVNVAATDAAGNVTNKEVTKDYSRSELGAAPTMTLESVATDNVINIFESNQEFIIVQGSAIGYEPGDSVKLRFEGEISSIDVISVNSDGSFEFQISTALLSFSSNNVLVAELVRNDSVVWQDSITYSVDTTPPTAFRLFDIQLTNDNLLNFEEQLETVNVLSGKTDASAGAEIEITVNGNSYTAVVADNQTFSVEIATNDLLDTLDEQPLIQLALTRTEISGNVTETQVEHNYAIASPSTPPQIYINKVTGDDILSARDIADGQAVEISGSVSLADDGDEVVITVNGNEYTTTLDEFGYFSFDNILGADLAADPDFDVRVSTVNELGNEIVGEITYNQLQVSTAIIPPEVRLDVLKVNDDKTIEIQFIFSKQVTRHAIFDSNDQPIGYKPFVTTDVSDPNSTVNSIIVENGILVGFEQSQDNPLIWTATFEPDVNNQRALIKLTENSFSDLDGTYNAKTVIQPLWIANTSSLLIDYSATVKANFYTDDNPNNSEPYTNNEPLIGNSYKTDGDDEFLYEFGRLAVSQYDVWDNGLQQDVVLWKELAVRTWQVGVGDKVKGALFLDVDFAAGETVAIPNSFGASMGGDDQIDEGQYEVYYGTYVADVFTVLTTEEFKNSALAKSTSTHTMVMFDNDTQNRRTSEIVDYLRENLDFLNGENLALQLLSAYDNAINNGFDEQWMRNEFAAAGAREEDFDQLIGYMRQPFWLDAMIFEGVLDELKWKVTDNSTNQLLSWNVELIEGLPAVNTSSLEINYSDEDKTGKISGTPVMNENLVASYKSDSTGFVTLENGGFGRNVSGEWKNWQVGPGDQVKNAVHLPNFDGSQLIMMPWGLSDSSDDQIDNGDYDIYYGSYVNGTFTILNTENFVDSTNNKMGSTHTLIMYDNDNRSAGVYGAITIDSYPFYIGAIVVDGIYLENSWTISEDQKKDGRQALVFEGLSWDPTETPVGGIALINDDYTVGGAYGEDSEAFITFQRTLDADGSNDIDLFAIDVFAESLVNELDTPEFDRNNFSSDGIVAKLYHNGVLRDLELYFDDQDGILFAAIDDTRFSSENANLIDLSNYSENGLTSQGTFDRDRIILSGSDFEYSYYLSAGDGGSGGGGGGGSAPMTLEFAYADDGDETSFSLTDEYLYLKIEDVLREAMFFESMSTLAITDSQYYPHWTGDGYLRSREDVDNYSWQITDLSNPSVLWDGEIVGEQIRFAAEAYGNGNVNQNDQNIYQDYKITATYLDDSAVDFSYIINGRDDSIWVRLPESEINANRDLFDFTWTLENLVEGTSWTGVIWEGGDLVNFDARAYTPWTLGGLNNESPETFKLTGTLIGTPVGDSPYTIEKVGFSDFFGSGAYPFVVI